MSDEPVWGTPSPEGPSEPEFVAGLTDVLPVDDRLVAFLLAEVKKRHGVDPSNDEAAVRRIREAAGRAQAELASAPSTTVCLPYLAIGKDGPIDLDVTITKARLREITRPARPATSSGTDTGRRMTKAERKAKAAAAARSRRRRKIAVSVAVPTVGVALAVGGWLLLRPAHYDVWSATTTPQVIDDLIEEVGGPQFVRIDLYSDHAFADAPTAPGATTVDDYSWHDGGAKRDGPEGELDDALFDATTVDWTAIEGFVAQASELSGIDDTPWAVHIARATGGWGTSESVEVWYSVCDDYSRCATITADQTGQIVWMDSPVEGSPAFEWDTTGLYSTERAQRAIGDLLAVAGSTQFTRIDLGSDSLWAKALTAPGDSRVDELRWYSGFAAVADTAADEADPARLFDISEVDWTLVEGLVEQARDLTGIDDPRPDVRVEHAEQWESYSGLVFEVSLYDGSTSKSVVFDMAGQVVEY